MKEGIFYLTIEASIFEMNEENRLKLKSSKALICEGIISPNKYPPNTTFFRKWWKIFDRNRNLR